MIKHCKLLVLSTVALLGAGVAHAEQFTVALFTKAAGWHHESIPAAVAGIRQLGQLHDFGVFWTEDAGRVMNDAELAHYRAVIFLLTTGNILNAEQKAAVERYIRGAASHAAERSLDDMTAAYYASLGLDEREENEAIARASSRAAKTIAYDVPTRRGPRRKVRR